MSEKEKKIVKKEKNPAVAMLDKVKSSKPLLATIIAVAVILVAFFGIAIYANTYDGILPGVTVNGIDVGGLSLDEAEKLIQEKIVNPVQGKELVLKCEDNQKILSVDELTNGGINAAYIANQAYNVGRDGGWFSTTCSLIGSWFGTTEIKAAAELNMDVFRDVVHELSDEYSDEVKETEFFLEGETLVITKGKGGHRVNMERAKKQVGQGIVDANVKEIVFLIEEANPKDVDVDEFYSRIAQPKQDAYYKKENGQIVVVDEVHGITVDKSAVEKALKSDKDREEIKVKVDRASKTSEELEGMLFRDVMGEWSSDYSSSSAARANNVELAADRMNGYVLMPGEVFSYDQTILPRTTENGYQMAGVYIGNRSDVGIGGGICQPSSTLYGAVLYANLEIVTRTSHSLPVAYVPAGQDATIAQGAIDFQFRNNTEYPVKVVATYGGRRLTCKILGIKPAGQTVEVQHSYTGSLASKVVKSADASIPEGYKKTVARGKSGSTYSSVRIVKVNGEEVKRENLTRSVYNATDTEVLVNPADMGASPDALTEYTGQEIEVENPEGEETEGEGEEGSETPSEEGEGTEKPDSTTTEPEKEDVKETEPTTEEAETDEL